MELDANNVLIKSNVQHVNLNLRILVDYANAKQELIFLKKLALVVVELAYNVQMVQFAKHVMEKITTPLVMINVSAIHLIMSQMMELTAHVLQDIMINRTSACNALSAVKLVKVLHSAQIVSFHNLLSETTCANVLILLLILLLI